MEKQIGDLNIAESLIENKNNSSKLLDGTNLLVDNVLENNLGNSDMLNDVELAIMKYKLSHLILKLKYRKKGGQPITIIKDSTFDELFDQTFKELFRDDFIIDDFVKIIRVDYTSNNTEKFNQNFEKEISNNSLVLIAGSFSDVHEISDEIKNSNYFQYLKDVSSGESEKYNNTTLVGVCFGHQLIMNILGHKVEKYKEPEFGRYESIVQDNDIQIYNDIYGGVTKNGKHNKFTVGFTRNYGVEYDSNTGTEMISLTNNNNSFGNKKGNVFTYQFHPEIDMCSDDGNQEITNILTNVGLSDEKIFYNSDKLKVEKNIRKHFYIPMFYSILKQIDENMDK